jgi:hypothetical protein
MLSVQDPMPVTNNEQTCSLFSLALYIYLDPVIFLGARVKHLKYDQLPPLSDSDYAKNLTKMAFPVSFASVTVIDDFTELLAP